MLGVCTFCGATLHVTCYVENKGCATCGRNDDGEEERVAQLDRRRWWNRLDPVALCTFLVMLVALIVAIILRLQGV